MPLLPLASKNLLKILTALPPLLFHLKSAATTPLRCKNQVNHRPLSAENNYQEKYLMPENTTQKDTKWLITCGLLVLCCFLLIAILLTLYKNNQNGRYALHVDNGFYILDTKTSHVWYRVGRNYFDYGTNEKPTLERQLIKEYTLVDLGSAPNNLTGH
jgi:hypothetical protein